MKVCIVSQLLRAATRKVLDASYRVFKADEDCAPPKPHQSVTLMGSW